MKAKNTTTNKALRILENIMEGYPEWFAKDGHHSASLEYTVTVDDYEIITAKFYETGTTVRKLNFVDIDDALSYLASNHYYNVAGFRNSNEKHRVHRNSATERRTHHFRKDPYLETDYAESDARTN